MILPGFFEKSSKQYWSRTLFIECVIVSQSFCWELVACIFHNCPCVGAVLALFCTWDDWGLHRVSQLFQDLDREWHIWDWTQCLSDPHICSLAFCYQAVHGWRREEKKKRKHLVSNRLGCCLPSSMSGSQSVSKTILSAPPGNLIEIVEFLIQISWDKNQQSEFWQV